jgi:GcrA cell cycle regulator
MEWSDEVVARLRALWADGHSTAEIGRRLGVSKNAVVGKAHRLDLPSRPSPIRRDGTGSPRPRAPRRVTGPTLPPLNCTRTPLAAPRAPFALDVAASATASQSVPRAPVLSSYTGRVVPCSWPLGEPGTKSFRFCDDGSLPGKPYCEAHAAIAYVRVRDRRDEVA